MARCLVTGGSGFIGSHVVDQLLIAGHEVAVLDRKTRPHQSDVDFLDVDLTDAKAVLTATRGCDYILHLGAVSDLNLALKDPAYSVQVNVSGSLNVLDAARNNGAKRVILASSVWVYSGSTQAYLDEATPFYIPEAAPIYSSTKIAAELLCHDYRRAFGQPFTILRYGTPYGPRMRSALAIHIFIIKALANQPISIRGDGQQSRNFLYVEELALAHVLALGDVAANQTYNLVGPRPVTIKEVVETLGRLLDRDLKIQYLAGRPGDDPGIHVSIDKARRDLGWQPTIEMEEGLRRTIEWYRANP